MTLAPVRLSEAADSLAKASSPEPFSTSRTSNWVARAGGLPAYIQHIAHDIMEKRGKSESNAIQIAIGVVKRWARGGGNVDSGTKAAAAKAVAEWAAMRAKSAAKKVGKALGRSQESWLLLDPIEPSIADLIALREAALSRLAVFEEAIGLDGMIGMMAEGALVESSAWNPTFKRTASARDEIDRHDVYDGAQHVGVISRRRGYGTEGDRHAAFALNGERVTDYSEKSRQGAIEALRKHLEEAPARVISWPTAGKFLVAKPSSYSGETSYTSYSSEGAARHAAGLPAQPTVPEIGSKVEAMAEGLRFDLLAVAHLDIPPLRRVQEARRRDPFDLAAEEFHPDELRGFHGKWVAGGGHHARLTPRSVTPGRRSARSPSRAAQRYEGGVTRASARLRAAHAAKPQIATATEKDPEKKLAAAMSPSAGGKSAAAASKRLLAQPQMGMDEIERKVKAGEAHDTESLHRTGPGGTYSKERKALHEEIISKLLQGKGVHEGKAEATFTAGGGASGKSRMVTEGHAGVPHDAVIANPDVIKAMLPEYKALKAAGREDAASLTHEESSHITKVLTRIALARQHHVLIDSVGDSGPGKFAGKIRAAQEAGHKVSVHTMTIPTEEAIRRSDLRGKRSGRYVDHGVLRQAHQAVSERFAKEISKMPGIRLKVYDNSGEGAPSVIAEHSGSPDKLVIRDREKFRGFLAKANERSR